MRGTRYVRVPKIPKVFPNYGDGRCLYCGELLTGRQRKFCRDWHGNEYRYQTRDYMIVNWGSFREYVLKRDDYKCVCGSKAEEVHHIVPIYKGGEEFDIDNCISLCHGCHMEEHRKLRKHDKPPEKYVQQKLMIW